MSLVQEQAQFLKHVTALLIKADQLGFVVTAGELFRTPEQQAIYVQSGRSKTMASNHMRRCAIDLNFFKDGALTWDRIVLKPLGDYWETLDAKNSWGGNWNSFKDVPHFERRP
jgi:D-alanyl-D-alanine carboxypeptidase